MTLVFENIDQERLTVVHQCECQWVPLSGRINLTAGIQEDVLLVASFKALVMSNVFDVIFLTKLDKFCM
jgi:hypothetical protein